MLASIHKPITTVLAALLLVPAIATAQIRDRRGTQAVYDPTLQQGTTLSPTLVESGPPPTGLTV